MQYLGMWKCEIIIVNIFAVFMIIVLIYCALLRQRGDTNCECKC
jgi:hypothetical protein